MRRNHEMCCKEHGATHRTTGARRKAAGSLGVAAASGSASAAAVNAGDVTTAVHAPTEFDENRR